MCGGVVLLLLPSAPSSSAAAEAEAGGVAQLLPAVACGEAAPPPRMLPLEPVSKPIAAAAASGVPRAMRRCRRPPLLLSPVRGAERGTPRRRRLWLVRLLLQLRRSSVN